MEHDGTSWTLNERVFEDDGDEDEVWCYSGCPCCSVLTALSNHIALYLDQTRRKLFPFQMLLMTLMSLRLNLNVLHLAHLFHMDPKTVSMMFHDTILVLHMQIQCLVLWPERCCLHVTVPCEFGEIFGDHVVIIVDCLELFVERPSHLQSNHHYTMKFLIRFTPRGAFTFISTAGQETLAIFTSLRTVGCWTNCHPETWFCLIMGLVSGAVRRFCVLKSHMVSICSRTWRMQHLRLLP